jgi:membrane-associated protease RseP (regulator of RpoE activity)
MNALGLAGVELHGVIGYTLLARYRIEFDFTRDKLAWTELDFDPPPPVGLGGGGPPEMDAMGAMVKVLTALLGKKPFPDYVPRGFLGIELEDAGEGVAVKAVLDGGPAARAGLKPGDRVKEFEGKEVKAAADLRRLAAALGAGHPVKLTILRDGKTVQVSFKTGEGL